MNFVFEVYESQPVLQLMHEGAVAGTLKYREDENYLVIEHLEVDGAYRGQGLARKLVDHFTEHVRGQGTRVVAECGAARRMMSGDERYVDVLIGAPVES